MKLLALAISLLSLGPAFSASFDCSKARSNHEKFICSNPEVNDADSLLGIAYSQAMKSFRYSELIRDDQRNWLRIHYRDCGAVQKCVKLLRERIQELNSYRTAKIFTNSVGTKNFSHEGGTIIFIQNESGFAARFLGNWMPQWNMDPNKMKGFPHDGHWCDDTVELQRKGNTFTPKDTSLDFSLLVDDKKITMKGWISCSPRTGFGEGVYPLL